MQFGIYTLFTKSRRLPSTRLRILARALQWYGIAIALSTVGLVLYKLTAPSSKIPIPFEDVSALKLLAVGALQCASLLVIGRALRRRQRWGAYLTVATLTAPIVSRWGTNQPTSVSEIFMTVAALATLVTVWKELRSARDMDLVDEGDPEEEPVPDPMPKGSRGYRERRTLPLDTMPTTTTAAAKAPLPINNPRAH